MATITGTFTAQGQTSEPMLADNVQVMMDFAGTASVAVEAKLPQGSWIILETATADYCKIVEMVSTPVRLRCTAFTNSVDYALSKARW